MRRKQKNTGWISKGCLVMMIMGGLVLSGCKEEPEVFLEEYGIEVQTEIQTTQNTELCENTEQETTMYCVHVCGAVVKPGVYMLPAGSRVFEAIEMAGGLSENADGNRQNQAEVITDGQMIRIYTCEEIEEGILERVSDEERDRSQSDTRVNINTAGKMELMTLPGIGDAKAELILSYREENGPFSDIGDLMKIPGIKEGIFEQIKELIKVN